MRIDPVFLFDLDGTLVDSVYQHVLAWSEALNSEQIELSVWRIHRRVGLAAACSPTSCFVKPRSRSTMSACVACARRMPPLTSRAPIAGARELLAWLSEADIPWAIATSGRMETAAVNLAALGVDPARTPVVTRDQVNHAKPDPDLFLAAAEEAERPDNDGDRGRRQHLGHAGCNAMQGLGRRSSERRIRRRGAAAVGRHSRL